MKAAKWYVDKKLKPPKSFWDWCYKQIPIFKWSNNSETIVSSDRQGKVIEKRLTKRSKLTYFDKFMPMAIILVTRKRIEIQSYGFWIEYVNGKEKIQVELTNFEQFANNRHIKVGLWFEKYGHGLVKNFGMMGGPYERTQFFDNDWKSKIQNQSELKYLDFYDADYSRIDLAQLYKYRFEIEYLQKIGSHKLAKEVMYPYTGNIDMRTINRAWLKANKHSLKNRDVNFRSYELERRIKDRNGKLVPGIEKFLDYTHIRKIPKGIGIVRFQNWIIKHEIDIKYYLDYLEVQKDLGVTMDTEQVIIPKDLRSAHDNAVRLLNQMEREAEEKIYVDRLAKLDQYERKIGEYLFIVPKTIQELIVEGKELNHCVGTSGYADRHSSGKTTIIFIRHKEELNKPYYTMEYQDERIVQIRGLRNNDAPEEVKEVANQWLMAISD